MLSLFSPGPRYVLKFRPAPWLFLAFSPYDRAFIPRVKFRTLMNYEESPPYFRFSHSSSSSPVNKPPGSDFRSHVTVHVPSPFMISSYLSLYL